MNFKTLILLLAAALLVLYSGVQVRASSAEAFEFSLLLVQIQEVEKLDEKLEKPNGFVNENSKLIIHDYRKVQKAGWPKGGIVYVSAPNCKLCKVAEKYVFTDHRVIELLNSKYVFIKTNPKDWRIYRGKSRMGFPFLMSVKPGGMIQSRASCPTTADGFLKLFEKDESK